MGVTIMAVIALAVVSGIAQHTDNTYQVELDIISSDNNRAKVLAGPFTPEQSAPYVNIQLLLFVKAFILAEWGITSMLSDTVKLLRPLQEIVDVQSLGRRPGWWTAGW